MSTKMAETSTPTPGSLNQKMAMSMSAGALIGGALSYIGASSANKRIAAAQRQTYKNLYEQQGRIQQHAAFRRYQTQRLSAQRAGALRAIVGKPDVGSMGMFGQIDFNLLYNNVVTSVDTAGQMAESLGAAIAQVTRLQTGVKSPGLAAVQGGAEGAAIGGSLRSAWIS